MIKFFLIVCGILILCVVIFFFLWRLSANQNKQKEEIIYKLSKQICDVNKANAQLEQTINILKKNRRKADEKVDNLHNGDSVGNALHELCDDKD